MSALTSIKPYTTEQLQTVIGYSEENERIRQTLISRNFDAFGDKECFIDAKFKQAAIFLASNRSDNYDGGYWDYNEHGLLTLATDAESLEFDAAYSTLNTSIEEFSHAISVFAANGALWEENIPEFAFKYFEYLYHLGHCLLGDAEETETFDPSKILTLLD